MLVMTRTKLDKSGKLVGYPYGSIPRLLLYWLTSEALRTKSPVLKLGVSLNEFMSAGGLSIDTGGGKRSNAVRVREQMNRLFSASIRVQAVSDSGRDDTGAMLVTKRTHLWCQSISGIRTIDSVTALFQCLPGCSNWL